MPVSRLKRLNVLSPLYIALALGSFSVYLIYQGQVDAAMGGAGAAVAAATMKRNEDFEQESIIEKDLEIQKLKMKLEYQEQLREFQRVNMQQQVELHLKDRELKIALKEQEVKLKAQELQQAEMELKQKDQHLQLKNQELDSTKALPESKTTSVEFLKLEATQSEVSDPNE